IQSTDYLLGKGAYPPLYPAITWCTLINASHELARERACTAMLHLQLWPRVSQPHTPKQRSLTLAVTRRHPTFHNISSPETCPAVFCSAFLPEEKEAKPQPLSR